jgi:hypothetical protein
VTRPTFAYPFIGDYPVSSPYGPRGDSFHTGTDFAVPAGVPILASNDGQVIYVAYEHGGAGNTVTIAGDDGWQSRYHHLQEWCVYTGQPVRLGDTIGFCDSTGASSGPHLHFEIRSNNGATTHDPIPILDDDAAGQPAPPAIDVFDTEDAMLIINRDNGDAAVLFGACAPRKVPSVNDVQRMAFVVLDHDAFEAFFAQQLAVFTATTG